MSRSKVMGMDKRWHEYFLLYSQTEEFQKKLELSKNIIEKALTEFKKHYISYSGGKDSTALMHMVLKQKEDTTVIHWDFGRYYIPRKLHNEIINNARRCGAKNLLVLTSPLYDKLKRNAQGILGKCFIGIEIPKLIKQGYDCAFIGLRAEESVKRKLKTQEYYEYDKRGIMNVYPLRDWTWRDVWAYIISNNVPYLDSFYDKYAKLLGYDKARFVTLFDKEFDKFGSENIDRYLMWRLYEQ